MHCPTPLIRSLVAVLAPAFLLSLANATVAADGSLSARLAQLHEAWTSDATAQATPSPRPASGDLFDALGGRTTTPRVASREMATAKHIPSPITQRAGSVLSPPSRGIDIGAALGGTELMATTPEPTPAPTQTTDASQTAESADEPSKVAAKPAPMVRRTGEDLALDLISSTASSRDTSGVANEQAPISQSATDLFPSNGPALESAVEDSAGADDSMFGSASAAAEAAEFPFDADPTPVAAPEPEQTAPATSSATAERAFGIQSGSTSDAAAGETDNDVWISTPSTNVNSFNQSSAAENVLMTEQLPLITSKVTGPKSILIGREAKYQVTVENRGTAAAEQLTTEVVAPAWADVVHAMASSGAVQRQTDATGGASLQWDVSSLAAGHSQTLDLVIVPKTSQPLSLGVSWRHAPVAATTMVEVQEPKLAMAISGPKEVFYGRPQSYRLSISNPGTGAAENVVVQLIPPGGGQPASSYRVEQLAAGESKVVDIEITAREPGELAIKAVAAADGNLRSEALQDIFCRQAELNVDWRGPARKYAGTEATYYFRVRNPGTASAEQVEFDVTLPAGFEFRGASDGHHVDRGTGRVIWKIGTLRPGDDCYLELRGIVNQAGENQLRLAAANAGGDVHDSKTAATQVVALADLKLDVSDPKGPVPVGAEVDYEITVTNRGRSTAEEVNVVGLFSAGIEPIAALGGEATIGDGRVGFRTIGSLGAGQQVKLKIRARAQSAGTHLFRAEVLCRDLEIKLAAEETTRFFQDESTASSDGATVEAASRASRFE